MPRHLWKKCKARLSNFINPQGWHFPSGILLILLVLGIRIQNIQCNPSSHDIMIWKPDIHSPLRMHMKQCAVRKTRHGDGSTFGDKQSTLD
ncbi:hypothetical protein GIB67_014914 [Kingdonia uniflora]|uniref:Uncharacterized protein n=1 Tax=Kingdonia uniflora TaxID=39325 RepID=A0A7J7MTL1_9MAGN|nr:hypothetical protein GIB67_014914 [Kingdonia uniflora]